MRRKERQLEMVYNQHRVAVYHTALTFLKDTAAAEDVMQEVFLSYYRELEQKKPVRHLKAWLLTVTRNKCKNVLRDRKGEQHESECALLGDDPLNNIQEQDTVQRALSCLHEQQRLVFSLHYLDGYTYKEIAQGLDIPVGTVQTRCRAACKKLREVLRNMQTREEMQV